MLSIAVGDDTISRNKPTTFRNGEKPRKSKTVASRYRHPKGMEMHTIRIAAAPAPDASGNNTNLEKIRLVARPASSEATIYLQTSAITAAIPRPIGLPAYHNAGTVNIQKEAHHATAIP